MWIVISAGLAPEFSLPRTLNRKLTALLILIEKKARPVPSPCLLFVRAIINHLDELFSGAHLKEKLLRLVSSQTRKPMPIREEGSETQR